MKCCLRASVGGLLALIVGTLAGCAAPTTKACAHPSSMQPIKQLRAAVQNRLPDCVSVSFEDVVAARNVLLWPTQLTLTQSIGACGCLPSLMRYRVSAGGPDAPLSGRDFVVDLNTRARRMHEAEALHFVIAPDTGRVASAPLLTVELTCTPAE